MTLVWTVITTAVFVTLVVGATARGVMLMLEEEEDDECEHATRSLSVM